MDVVVLPVVAVLVAGVDAPSLMLLPRPTTLLWNRRLPRKKPLRKSRNIILIKNIGSMSILAITMLTTVTRMITMAGIMITEPDGAETLIANRWMRTMR